MPGTRVAVCACAALGQPRALDFISFVDFYGCVHKEAVMFHGPASTMKHIQGQRMSLCFVSGCMVPWWSRQVPVLPRGPSVPDVFLCVQQYSLGKNILGKDYAPVFQTVGNLSSLQ